MNLNRMWILGSVLVVIALVAGGWFVAISPKLEEASAANAELATAEGTNAVHAVTLVALKKQFEQLDELEKKLEELQVAIPSDVDLDSFLTQLNTLALSNGVAITSIAVSDPRAFMPEEASALVTLEVPEIQAALSSVTADNFLTIPIQISIRGSYSGSLAFISDLQAGERLFLALNVSLDEGAVASGGDTFGTVEMVVEGQAYVLRSLDTVPAGSGEVSPPAEAEAPVAAG